MKNEHTPTPWRYIPPDGPHYRAQIAMPAHESIPDQERIGCAPGSGIWDDGEDEANAAFIVEAVNSHTALTERVAELKGYIQNAITSLTICLLPRLDLNAAGNETILETTIAGLNAALAEKE